MNKQSMLLAACLTAGVFAGCSDSSSTSSSSKPSASATPSTPSTPGASAASPSISQPAAPTADATAAAAAEAKKAVDAAAASVPPPPAPAKAATAATTDGAAAAADAASASAQSLGNEVTTSVASSPDPVVKNIGTDLGSKVTMLTQSLAGNEAAKAQVTSAVQSLLGKKDGEAVSGLGKVTDSKLTPEQSALAKDVYNAASALVLQRNLSSVDGMNSDVTKLTTSVWKGNYTEALPPLQKIWTQAKLTDSQKDLLGSTFDKVSPGWRDNAAKLQQGLNTLKSFGK